jgi:ribosomal protein L11 methyltransferase
MPWLQLTLTIERSQAPAAELLFEGLGALSITYADAEDQPLLEPAPGETPLWQQTRITALFEGDTDPAPLRERLQAALPAPVFQSLEQTTLDDQVWERVWLNDFQPMRFGRRLWVCPDGQRPDDPRAVAIDLDPGLAFGTGTHPTTALCLQWLDGTDLARKTVLDFGCGSGVLGIAAARLGASRVVALDHDPQAIEATLANAEKNGVSDRIAALPAGAGTEERFDIVLANILAGTLTELAPLIGERVTRGGQLLLSGILTDQAQTVIDAYGSTFRFEPVVEKDGWVLLHARRADSS